MSEEIKYPFPVANKVANYIADQLRPHCTRLHIAGSIRRLKPEVKDIEIVCEPKTYMMQHGLFADMAVKKIVVDFTVALITVTDKIIKGNTEGRYMQVITSSTLCPGIKLDLFMPQPEDYYRILAMRTGSWEYSKNVIATAWVKKGWAGVKDVGLRKISECNHLQIGDTKHYRLKPDSKNPTLPPVWNSEAEFFMWLNIPYIDPEHRIISHLNEAL